MHIKLFGVGPPSREQGIVDRIGRSYLRKASGAPPKDSLVLGNPHNKAMYCKRVKKLGFRV